MIGGVGDSLFIDRAHLCLWSVIVSKSPQKVAVDNIVSFFGFRLMLLLPVDEFRDSNSVLGKIVLTGVNQTS